MHIETSTTNKSRQTDKATIDGTQTVRAGDSGHAAIATHRCPRIKQTYRGRHKTKRSPLLESWYVGSYGTRQGCKH